jgi:hypothetical protein
MGHTLRHALLAGGMLLAATASAQTEQMIIHTADGAVRHFAVSEVDSVTFGKEAAEENPLNLTIDKVGQLYAIFATKPGEDVGTYNVMQLSASDYALYQSEDDVVADDITYFKELATGYGMTLEDILSYYLYTGETSDIITGVTPDTEYVVWGYGMDGTGALTTPFYKTTFRTAAVEKKEGSIAITTGTDADGNLTVTFTPDDATRPYVSGFLSSNLTTAQAEQTINKNTSSQLYDYYAGGEELSAAIEALASKGVTTTNLTGATAGTTYFAVAAYVSEGGAVESTVCKAAVTSGSSTTANSLKTTSGKAVFTPAKKAAPRTGSMSVLLHSAKSSR